MRSIPSAWVAAALVFLGYPQARGQSIGPGASPGRAAYRTPVQWNDGPYSSSPHINPYAPHRGGTANLYAAEPLAPPWSTRPHGRYSTFSPGRGTLYPYAEGFSPYSGYSRWYAQTNNIPPTRAAVEQGRALFFRSAPLPPPGVLPPLPPSLNPAAASTARPAPPSSAATANPIAPVQPAPRAAIPIYRSNASEIR